MTSSDTSAPSATAGRFGTFKGVFTPSLLTILGVIMYLRFGWVVGEAGLVGAIVVVLLAHTISVTTGMSISSIATNRTVGTGGDYYMISRSLGLPIGGAIGVALFIALALSTSLYVIGFAESLLSALDMENTLLARQITGTVAVVLLTALTFFSTSLALRVQYLVLAAIGLSIVSLFFGHSDVPPADGPTLWFGADSESFEVVFGVFFPAVTGFTTGVAMSGDLKDPRRSIPRGTLAAIGVGLLVYLAIPVFLAYKVDPAILRGDPLVWLRVSPVPALVYAGVFAATLSSALGSILGAPRYLQALANDGVAPRILGRGHGPANEPRIGTLVTFAIAEVGVLVGELNLVARIITMFFLTSYGFLSLACAVQTWSGIPSFRPTFRTPVAISLAGAFVCVAIMFKLDALAMFGASVVMFGIFAWLRRRELQEDTGDTWGGFWAAVVQHAVLRLHKRAVDSLNWRSNALVFGGVPTERQHLVRLARWLFEGRGLATYFYVRQGRLEDEIGPARQIEPQVRELVGSLYPEMLTRISVAPDVYEGIRNASQSYGLSGMVPNTVLLGWAGQTEEPSAFAALVHDLLLLDHNLLLLRHDANRSFGGHKSVDVWWGGLERNGALMLLLAHMLTNTESWHDARLRVNVVVDDPDLLEAAETNLEEAFQTARVRAQANVIVREDAARPITEIMAETSATADLVILGLRPPESGEADFVDRTNVLMEGLGSVLLVRGSERFDGAALLFDD